MVKLRVAARVIPEDEYLKYVDRPTTNAPVRGEKRLVVIVRDPYKWQIGTLALEVQRAYQSCYQQELPLIKYLKDNEDDCDLDPQLYVSDLLLDEGKAQRDGSDQRVTIKVILEQGRAVREGSVAIGSQLDDPQYQVQLHRASRPPVPAFPGVPSSLGKRAFASDESQSRDSLTNGTGKRVRQIEIPETPDEQDGLLSSIEEDEDVPAESVELVQNTQTPGSHSQRLPQVLKLESPDESWRSLRGAPPPPVDELEELPDQPPAWVTYKKPRTASSQSQSGSRPNGVLLPSRESLQQLQKPLHTPITPPSEVSRQRSTSAGDGLQPRTSNGWIKTSAAAQPRSSSSSAGKFKRADIYDYPESDIDDSQMSPRSRQAQLSHKKPLGRLSHIEDLQSPEASKRPDNQLSLTQAIDTLDDGSVFADDSRPVSQHLEDDAKENIPPKLPFPPPKRSGPSTTEQLRMQPGDTPPDPTQADTIPKSQSTSKRNRKRKSRGDNTSIDDGASSIAEAPTAPSGASRVVSDKMPSPEKATKSPRKGKEIRRTPSLDSPGEQLSQDLQQSAAKSLSTKSLKKRLSTEKKKDSTTPKSEKKKKSKEQSADASPPKKSKSKSKDPRPEQTTSDPQIVLQTSTDQNGRLDAVARPLITKSPEKDSSAKGKPKAADLLAVTNDTRADSRLSSPYIGTGYSEEELKIMKEREGMTAEEYKKDKQRRQLEAKKAADEHRKQEAATKKRKSDVNKSAEDKSPMPNGVHKNEAESATSAKKVEKEAETSEAGTAASAKPKGRKSVAAEETPKAAVAGKDRTATSATTTPAPAAKKNPLDKDSAKSTTTPAAGKTPSKSPSARSSTTSKTANVKDRPNGQTPAVDRVPQSVASASQKSSTPASSSKKEKLDPLRPANKSLGIPSAPRLKSALKASPAIVPALVKTPRPVTLESARSLVDLRTAMQSASDNLTAPPRTPFSRVQSTAQSQKSSLRNSESSDDDDEDDSEDSSDESDVRRKPPQNRNAKTQLQAKSPAKPPPTSQPDRSIRDASVDSDSDSDSDSSDSSDP